MADNIDIQPEFEEDRDPESASSRLDNQADDISQSSRSRMPDPVRAQRKRSRLDSVINEVVGDGDRRKKKQFREVLLNLWKQQRSKVDEHNSILREIGAQGKRHGPLAANISKGLDVTRLKGFDELVQFAENNYPGFLGNFKGDTTEDRLVSAMRTGIQRRPRPWNDEIVSMAMGSMGEDFFEGGAPIQPSDPTGFDFTGGAIGGSGGGGGNNINNSLFGYGDDSFDDDPNNLPQFDPKSDGAKEQKERNRKIAAAQRLQAKKDREQATRDRLQATRQNQDNNRKINEEGKSSLAASRANILSSREQITGIRSQATGARIGAYSLASALGLQGYVAASLADQFLIRPAETKAAQQQKDYIQSEKQYQQDLAAYQTRAKQAELERARNAKDDISNRPITAVALDENGNPIHPASQGTSAATGNGPGGGGTPNVGPGAPTPSNPGGGKGGSIPPIIPGTPPIRPTPPGGGFGGGSGALIAAAGTAIPIVTAIIGAAKIINNAVEATGKRLSTVGTSIISGNSIAATKESAQIFKKYVDPFGLNVGAQIAVSGFDLLLDINQAILDSIKNTTGFAPQTLRASVEGDLAKFFQQIETAKRLDSVTAELVRANTQFDLAWEQLRAELIEAVVPLITATLPVITVYLKQLATAIDITEKAVTIGANSTVAGRLLLEKLVWWALGLSTPADAIDANLQNQLESFFSADKAEQNLRRRRVFPT